MFTSLPYTLRYVPSIWRARIMICIGFSLHRCSQCTLIRYVSDRGRLMVNIYGTTICVRFYCTDRIYGTSSSIRYEFLHSLSCAELCVASITRKQNGAWIFESEFTCRCSRAIFVSESLGDFQPSAGLKAILWDQWDCLPFGSDGFEGTTEHCML